MQYSISSGHTWTGARSMRQILGLSPVIPVVTIGEAEKAVPMAQALAEGGLRLVEITLRTPAALPAIREIRAAVPELIVAAGTVVSTQEMEASLAAGAHFLVSPGSTPALLCGAAALGAVYLPGIASASDIMLGLEHGYDCFKFFPAAPLGPTHLKALAAPFPQIALCATGGITKDAAQSYLDLPLVQCLGASWVASERDIGAADWSAITGNARYASDLLRNASEEGPLLAVHKAMAPTSQSGP